VFLNTENAIYAGLYGAEIADKFFSYLYAELWKKHHYKELPGRFWMLFNQK
jgi:hypothetical protein